MRKLLEPEQITEPVRHFLGELAISDEASVVEINGRLVYLIVRPVRPTIGDATWDDARQQRRLELIKRRVRQEIEPLERVELEELQEQFDCYLSHAAPVPMDYANELLARLQTPTAPTSDQP